MNTLNILGQKFADELNAAATQNDIMASANQRAKKIHVSGAGRTLTFAYEQLRNAAEYAEDNLLQYAIRRFYKRVFMSRDEAIVKTSGEDLIIELTMAGYLQNDSVTTDMIKQINELAIDHFTAHLKYKNDDWTIGVLAVEVEYLLGRDLKREVFAQFAFDYYLQTINRKKVFGKPIANFEIVLFIAVNRALFKSDHTTIRAVLLRRYQQKPGTDGYKHTNKMIDHILVSGETDRVYRFVDRKSASLRILWRLIEKNDNVKQLFNSRDHFLTIYSGQIESEYSQTNARINKGIIKSVIFLIITKTLIGISIEVPYDFATNGAIIWLPLIINLLFPPIYMILLRFTLNLPGNMNALALTDSIDEILFGDERTVMLSRKSKAGLGATFNIIYGFISIFVFGGVAALLFSFGFSLLHLIIFFLFLSAASFLGFRLSRQIRELEAIEGQESGITMLRDFFYIPFVVAGRWISDKYSKVNIVAVILDVVIELPLKTTLHLIRQWGTFITNKKDEI